MALRCQHCGKGVNSIERKKKHEKVCGLGATTDSGHTPVTHTSESHSVTGHSVTEQNPNPITDLPVTQAPESHSVTASTSSPDDLVVGVTRVTESVTTLPAPGVNSPDAIETVKDRQVIDFLAGHTGLLEPRELRFFHGVKYRVYGNGGLSPAQRAWLYEIEAVVRGLLEEIARETEQSRRAQHWLAAKDPKHKRQGCDLCRESEIEQAEADKRADIGLLEDAKVLQQTARRKGLRVPTIEELMGEALVARVTARSLQGDPAARACIENLREFSA